MVHNSYKVIGLMSGSSLDGLDLKKRRLNLKKNGLLDSRICPCKAHEYLLKHIPTSADTWLN